jgi:Ethanolamine ammonia-lyase, large subunit
MAKLHGLTMGLDVCATFHMGISPSALQETTRRIVELAAPAYLMAVAGNADPMLGYLTTSFREHPRLRGLSGGRITTAMSTRLAALGARVDGDAGRTRHRVTLRGVREGRRRSTDDGRVVCGRCFEDREPSRARYDVGLRP